MPVHVFTIESKVRGYHVCKGIWNPSMDGRQLPEIGNSQDPCAVAVMENLIAGSPTVIIGHVPHLISTVCSIFIQRGGSLTCIVTGARQYSEDFPQGGLEILCKYVF